MKFHYQLHESSPMFTIRGNLQYFLMINCSVVLTYIPVSFKWILPFGSRHNVVRIATGYGLNHREVVVQTPVRVRSSPLHIVQTGSEANPTSYPKSTVENRPEREAYLSPSTSVKVKNRWIYTSTPIYAFMA
jgi:hypothetical protein